jgi:hypothetical protein
MSPNTSRADRGREVRVIASGTTDTADIHIRHDAGRRELLLDQTGSAPVVVNLQLAGGLVHVLSDFAAFELTQGGIGSMIEPNVTMQGGQLLSRLAEHGDLRLPLRLSEKPGEILSADGRPVLVVNQDSERPDEELIRAAKAVISTLNVANGFPPEPDDDDEGPADEIDSSE